MSKLRLDEYVQRDCCCCPFCGTYDLSGDQAEFSYGNRVVQDCSCNVCGARWSDVYRLCGTYITHIPDPTPPV